MDTLNNNRFGLNINRNLTIIMQLRVLVVLEFKNLKGWKIAKDHFNNYAVPIKILHWLQQNIFRQINVPGLPELILIIPRVKVTIYLNC